MNGGPFDGSLDELQQKVYAFAEVIESPERVIESVRPDADNESMILHYCTGFEHNSGIAAIVRARTKEQARRTARDPYYGSPSIVRPATNEELNFHLGMGGIIIEAA